MLFNLETYAYKVTLNNPKFKEKPREHPSNHIRTFHMWNSLNSIMNDSVSLWLFQRTLIGIAATWHIFLKDGAYSSFVALALKFFNHFQLPIR